VKFPKRLRHKGKGRVLATIYKRPGCYRLYWRARIDGKPKSLMTDFGTYAEAKREGDKKVAELAKGKAAGLSPGQAADAQNALEELQRFYQATGKRISIRFAVGEWCENSRKLAGRNLGDAIDGFLRTVASVKRKDIGEAVTEFLQADAPRTKASNGQRAQLSAEYAYNRQIQLRRFADTFPNTAICDLSKEHLDKFIDSLAEIKTKSRNKRKAVSAKTRNHYRAAVRQFLQWAVRKDYLSVTHRLGEADGLRPEHANTTEVSFYTPLELTDLLANANDTLRPLVAIGALAGLRTTELLRLDWADVWRVPGYIEITAGKSKTRQRRLVEICPALSAWLESFRTLANGKLWSFHKITFQRDLSELCKSAEVPRKANGLRHSFCSYHFSLHANENLTAQQAGNSPQMIHGHYKGLATKAEAEKWFNVMPKRPANVIALPKAQRE